MYINKKNVKIFKNSGICFCTLDFASNLKKIQHGGSFLARHPGDIWLSCEHICVLDTMREDALLTIPITNSAKEEKKQRKENNPHRDRKLQVQTGFLKKEKKNKKLQVRENWGPEAAGRHRKMDLRTSRACVSDTLVPKSLVPNTLIPWTHSYRGHTLESGDLLPEVDH